MLMTYIRLNHNIKTDEMKDLVELWGIFQNSQEFPSYFSL